MRKPTPQWIRIANEKLQAAFDHKRLWFAGSPMDEEFVRQKNCGVDIGDIEFIRPSDEVSWDDSRGKMIDFIENQHDMIKLTKTECATIQISTTSQGTQTFDLPQDIKRQKGPNRMRKDSYSALVLANWAMEVYFDMKETADAPPKTFTPVFIK